MKTSFRRSTLLVASLMLALVSGAANGQVRPVWTTHYADEGSLTNIPVATAVDTAGNCYVAGYTDNAGAVNGWVLLKYSPSGKLLWEGYYGGSTRGDRPTAMALDANGNAVVTGYAYNPSSSNDIATVKYDPEGNVLWAQQYVRPQGDDKPSAIAVDAAGNVYVVGTGYVSTSDSGYPYHYQTINTTYLTLKYNSMGNQLWAQSYAQNLSRQEAQSVTVDSAGNVYVGGISVFFPDPRAPGYNLAVVKYSPSGSQLKVLTYGQVSGTGGSGNVLVSVTPSNELYMAASAYMVGGGSYHFIIAKYTNDVLAWTQASYGIDPYAGNNELKAIGVDRHANVFLCGHGGKMDGGMTCLTMKYDPAGTQLWMASHNLVSTNNEYARGLVLDEAGNAFVSAYSMGPGASSVMVSLKYTARGFPLWAASYPSEGGGYNEPKGIAVGAGEAVYVAGACANDTGRDMACLKYIAAGRVNIKWLNGAINISTTSEPGSTNWLQISYDLANWSDLCSCVAETNGVCEFPCTQMDAPSQTGYYRISYR